VRYETFIALRYLRSRRRTQFISLITYFSVGGVAIGVAALAIVLSTMNGLETEVRQKILDTNAHLRVTTFHGRGIEGGTWQAVMDTLRTESGVTGVTPFIESEGLIGGRERVTAVIRGIDPATVDEVYMLSGALRFGSMDLGSTFEPLGPGYSQQVEYYGILVGWDLSQLVGNVGQKGYVAVLPEEESTSTIPLIPSVRPRNVKVTGVFQTGLYEYDVTYAYLGLEAAQDLLGMGDKVTGLAVRLDDMWSAETVQDRLERRLPYPYYIRTWIEQNKNLFAWMTIEKWAMFIVLGLIIMVAAFNIISTLIMVVLEKKREIGILKAMGASRSGVQRVFVSQGMVVGVIGTIIGLIIGYGFCWAQQTFRLISIPPDVYFISAVPIDMRLLDFILITLLSLLLCLLASLYPARRAASLVPVEAIRYE